MNKKLNNILLALFPPVALIVHGYYNSIMKENMARMYKFNPVFLIGIFLYFIVFGIFMYNFLVKDKDFNLVALIVGVLFIVTILEPRLFFFILSKKILPGSFAKIYSENTFYMGMVIFTIYVLIGIKKFKKN
ncbi:hypothetical protein [Miniphocaeibacter massiliensis]|uniref:hypothetical protein n=1 Tax=Miniphocaeibacter massiliensis TaxID=2041841 RepID=UPI000C1BD162|nr:hypothetical protein [Miniphocaeibacter massiliensis]